MWVELKRIVKPRSAIVLTATQPFSSRLVSSNYEMFRYEWVWNKTFFGNMFNVNNSPAKIHETVLTFGVNTPNYYPIKTPKNPKDLRYVATNTKGSDNYATIKNIDTSERKQRKWIHPKSIIDIRGIHNAKRSINSHPTQKPVALFEYLIKTYTLENEIVLDMTCGSGTTAIASRNLNRQFICGDYHLPYVELARTRLQNSDPYQMTVNKDGSKQLSLFKDLAS